MLVFVLIITVGVPVMYGCWMLHLAWKWLWNWVAPGRIVIIRKEVLEAWEAEPEFPTVSIVVAARNEENNLPILIPALLAQDYPAGQLEIIIVDDDSDDGSLAVIDSLGQSRVRAIALKRDAETGEPGFVAFKKRALREGIRVARGDLMLVTDADCEPPPAWVSAMVRCRAEHRAAMVAGPVMYRPHAGLLHAFQATDFLTMQGITAGVLRGGQASMANGANLLFDRVAYEAVGGYDDATMGLASGDDLMLMEKIRRRWPGSLAYCQDRKAIVPTEPPGTWSAFLSQRIRWASKNGKYPSAALTPLLILVYVFNLMLVAAAITGIWVTKLWAALVFSLGIKVFSEILLDVSVFVFFRRPQLLVWLVLLQPLHICYIVLSGFFGMIGRYEWKGRRVR